MSSNETVRISITIGSDTQALAIPVNMTLEELAARLGSSSSDPRSQFVAAHVNGQLCSLATSITQPCSVRFLDLTDIEGRRVYQRTTLFLLCAAVQQSLPDRRVSIQHSLSNGIYGEIYGSESLSQADLQLVEIKLEQLIREDHPIRTVKLSRDVAVKAIAETDPDRAASLQRLFEQLPDDPVTLHEVAGFMDYLDGPTLPTTRHAAFFKLRQYFPGFIVQTPEKADPPGIPPFEEQPRLTRVYREAGEWASMVRVSDVTSLNEMIPENGNELIRMNEALHEKSIARIADRIAETPSLRVIAIAGPSSSGKTTFSQRLLTQLRVNGLRPLTLHLDDYFRGRDQAPIDPEGDLDLEHIEVIDLELFNDHLFRLIQGETIAPPTYNFHTGKREAPQREVQLDPGQPVIIEGIHALNERLTASVPLANKFQIYISALTQINLHDRLRVHTTDVRLIRRMVRDARSRNYRAEQTLERWPSVRRGEERFVFPFQERADVIFNSGLLYELAVLKPFALERLEKVPRESPVRPWANRLTWLFEHFRPLSPQQIPPNSILREFIGGSTYS